MNTADALSCLNQTTPCDVSGDKIDFVKMVAITSALSAKQVELELEKGPELISVRQYVTIGDWSKYKLPHYLSVKDELCVLGYLVLRGDWLVIPQSMRDNLLGLTHEEHQGIVKAKNRLRAKGEAKRQNRTLLKALKVVQVEGKRWQDELQKFLLAYRSTPQASTGAMTVFLKFHKKIQTKLPELRRDKVMLNEEIRDRDWRNKVSQKVYGDAKCGAKENDIVPGAQVLLKNTKATGKLAPK